MNNRNILNVWVQRSCFVCAFRQELTNQLSHSKILVNGYNFSTPSLNIPNSPHSRVSSMNDGPSD